MTERYSRLAETDGSPDGGNAGHADRVAITLENEVMRAIQPLAEGHIAIL